MKTITHQDTYQCEICGFEHTRAEVAQYCESFQLPPINLKIGDSVLVQSRYDGLQETTVTDINIRRNGSFNFNNDPDVIKLRPDKNGIVRQLTIMEWIHKYHQDYYLVPHYWEITTADLVEIGKDGNTTNTWHDIECTLVTKGV